MKTGNGSTVMVSWWHRLVCVFAFVFTANAWALTPAEDVKKVVEDNLTVLIAKLEETRPLYHTNENEFYTRMGDALSELVDFRRIAARVMGKYGRMASREQRDQFVETFKRSLFAAYSKALIESGKFSFYVHGAEMLDAEANKARVDIDISSENGNKLTVAYSMYLNTEKNTWLLENMSVSGINVGLAFRDRFEQEMQASKGNLDKVISNWNADLDIKKTADNNG